MEIVSIENIPNSQISISNSLNQLGKTLNTLKNLKLTGSTSIGSNGDTYSNGFYGENSGFHTITVPPLLKENSINVSQYDQNHSSTKNR